MDASAVLMLRVYPLPEPLLPDERLHWTRTPLRFESPYGSATRLEFASTGATKGLSYNETCLYNSLVEMFEVRNEALFRNDIGIAYCVHLWPYDERRINWRWADGMNHAAIVGKLPSDSWDVSWDPCVEDVSGRIRVGQLVLLHQWQWFAATTRRAREQFLELVRHLTVIHQVSQSITVEEMGVRFPGYTEAPTETQHYK